MYNNVFKCRIKYELSSTVFSVYGDTEMSKVRRIQNTW